MHCFISLSQPSVFFYWFPCPLLYLPLASCTHIRTPTRRLKMFLRRLLSSYRQSLARVPRMAYHMEATCRATPVSTAPSALLAPPRLCIDLRQLLVRLPQFLVKPRYAPQHTEFDCAFNRFCHLAGGEVRHRFGPILVRDLASHSPPFPLSVALQEPSATGTRGTSSIVLPQLFTHVTLISSSVSLYCLLGELSLSSCLTHLEH